MKEVNIVKYLDVSPLYMENARTKYLKLQYYKPRTYSNVCRYKNLRILKDDETGADYHETVFQKIIDKADSDQFHVVTLDDEGRLDIISNQYYNTPRFWWIIAMGNNIIDPFDIPVGTMLRIPTLTSIYNTGGIMSSE